MTVSYVEGVVRDHSLQHPPCGAIMAFIFDSLALSDSGVNESSGTLNNLTSSLVNVPHQLGLQSDRTDETNSAAFSVFNLQMFEYDAPVS